MDAFSYLEAVGFSFSQNKKTITISPNGFARYQIRVCDSAKYYFWVKAPNPSLKWIASRLNSDPIEFVAGLKWSKIPIPYFLYGGEVALLSYTFLTNVRHLGAAG
jgi:hypothetical protein